MNREGNTGEYVAGVGYRPRPPADEHMPMFDMLPPAVRAALREAHFDFDHTAIFRAMRNGWSERQVVEAIRADDREMLTLAYQERGLTP